MDTGTKVACGLVATSLTVLTMCAVTTYERLGYASTLQSAEAALIALTLLNTHCEQKNGDPNVDWIEDEFSDAMQDQGRWCVGPVAQVLSHWDDSRIYQFKGKISLSHGIVLRWAREIDLSEKQQLTQNFLSSLARDHDTESRRISYEVFSFPQSPPLLYPHEIWLVSARIVNGNFGETLLLYEWVALPDPPTAGTSAPQTANELRTKILALGVSSEASGKDPDSIYRSILDKWQRQVVKVPVLNIELKFRTAIAVLSLISLIQVVWLAQALARVAINDDPALFGRLDLSRRLATTDDTQMGKLVSALDWLSLWGVIFLSLSVPSFCFLAIFSVYYMTGTEGFIALCAGIGALLSLAPGFYVVRKLLRLLQTLPPTTTETA